MNSDHLYHVCSYSEWRNAPLNQYRQMGPFTHLSTAHELDQSVRLHLAHQIDLILLCINPQVILDDLRWEDVSSRSTPMPHLYGDLPQKAIWWAIFLPNQPDQFGSRCPSVHDLKPHIPPFNDRFIRIDV